MKKYIIIGLFFCSLAWGQSIIWSEVTPDVAKPDPDWRRCLAISGNGRVWVVGEFGNSQGEKVFLSIDSGKTWNETYPSVNKQWLSADIDEDGSTILLGAYNDSAYVSVDTGNTWSRSPLTLTGAGQFYASAVTPDGRIMAFGDVLSHRRYVSRDYGVSWTNYASSGTAGQPVFDISDDGKYLVTSGQYVYLSSDSGATNVQKIATLGGYVNTISYTADTTLLTIGSVGSEWILKSVDQLTTFKHVQPDSVHGWTYIAGDSVCMKLIACQTDGRLYSSVDGGVSWKEEKPAGDINQYWTCVKMSRDGNFIIASVGQHEGGEALYRGTYSDSPPEATGSGQVIITEN